MANLYSAVSDFDKSQAKKIKEYSGILGLPTSNETVNVPNRNGYVYVRLRDNTSEIVQAYNEEVSPVYNLPVIVVRQGNGWRVKGRDIERYNDWGSTSSFLPEHHYQHEFNPDLPGGDVVFVYPQAFTPALASPSGTDGGPNVVIHAHSFKKQNGNWSQVGVTGTQSLLIYRPTDNTARVGMIYMDRSSGNPGILMNTGSSVAATTTGTHDLLQYLPALPNSDYEPLAMVRLVSGTTAVGWANLYDIRQFFGLATGSAGGSTNPAGSDTDIQFNQANSFGASYNWHYDYTNDVLIYGSGTPPTYAAKTFHIMQDQGSPGMFMWAWQSNSSVAPYIAGFKARGTRAVPQAIEKDDEIFRIRARGYNGVNYTATQAQLLFVAPYNWASGSHPLYASVWVTPSGSAQLQEAAEFTPNGVNLSAAKTYNISGSPHVHSILNSSAYSSDTPPTQVVTGSVWTKASGVLDVADDTNSWWSSANKRYTLPSGKYLSVGSLVASGVADQSTFIVAVYKNGAFDKLLGRGAQSGAGLFGAGGSSFIESDGNDFFELYVFSSDPDTYTLTGQAGFPAYCHFDVMKLS